MKNEAVNHTKMALLMRRLDLPRWGAAGLLELLWKVAAREAPAGDIGKLTNEEIAVSVDWSGDPDQLVEALVAAKWLDLNNVFRVIIHDWWDHAEDNVHAKVARMNGYFVCGKQPKLRSLRREEKAEIEVFYSLNPKPQWMTSISTTAVQCVATASATAAQDTAKPSQPYQAKPSQAEPGNSSQPVLPTEAERKAASLAVVAAMNSAMSEKTFDVPAFTRKLYARHPQVKRRDLPLAEMEMARAINIKGADPEEIDRVHSQMCATNTWRWEGGRSRDCQTLAEWLNSEGWKFPPDPNQSNPPSGGNGSGSYGDRRRDSILGGKPTVRESRSGPNSSNLRMMSIVGAYA